jgi:two-component system chemotaxis response regulator CheB
VSLDTGPVERFSRPNIDVTFISAAETYGERAIGVVLTGANDDGSAGLRRIADRGGVTIVEDPASATSATMPAAALRAVPQAALLPLRDIARELVRLSGSVRHRRPA